MLIVDPSIRREADRLAKLKQGSAGWLGVRTAVVTCSRLNDVLDFKRDGTPSQKRTDYMTEKIVESLTGDASDHYVTEAMQRGTELEPMARSAYANRQGVSVIEKGFTVHPRINRFGGSPDGFVGDDGMIEIKTCWKREKWLKTVMTRDYTEWLMQIQGNLSCNGRKWCDLVVFDDRFGDKGLHIARIPRDEGLIEILETGVIQFVAELDQQVKAAELYLGGQVT